MEITSLDLNFETKYFRLMSGDVEVKKSWTQKDCLKIWLLH